MLSWVVSGLRHSLGWTLHCRALLGLWQQSHSRALMTRGVHGAAPRTALHALSLQACPSGFSESLVTLFSMIPVTTSFL